MRIKALTRYNLSTIRGALIIFTICFVGTTILASVVNAFLNSNTVVFGMTGYENGVERQWSSGIMALCIFMLVISLVGSQSNTRFLITRSVSRKEIFVAKAVFMCLLAAIMGVLHMVNIYIDGLVRTMLGAQWLGLSLDVQIMQAPDMGNPLIFFAVSFSILLSFGAASYLLGSLLARWKIPTVVAISVLFVLFIALLGSTNLVYRIMDVFNFLFMDSATGLWIAIKQIGLAAIALAVLFPVMRGIIAVKQ